jgi:hypothetical protein
MPSTVEVCTKYTKTTVEIFFTGGEENVKCALCPLLETYSRNMCRRSGEYIADTRGRGYWCPLVIEKEETE